MNAMQAVHLTTTSAVHLRPGAVLAALATVSTVFVATISTAVVRGNDLPVAQSANAASRVVAPCDLDAHRDTWWASDDPPSNPSAPCQLVREARISIQRSILPSGRKPAAWYIGREQPTFHR